MSRRFSNQKGTTLVELTLVTAVAAFTLAGAAAYSIPMIEAEKMRSAVYDVQTMTQLARGEAVARNHECRFVVGADAGTLEVWDGRGTPNAGDDELLHTRTLPGSVALARPGSGSPVTLDRIGQGNSFQTSFSPDGMVASGSGTIFLHGAKNFEAISIVDAGGAHSEKWDGQKWQSAHKPADSTSPGSPTDGGTSPIDGQEGRY